MVRTYSENQVSDFNGTIIDIEAFGDFNRDYANTS
jgi:hypothetical protein